MAYKYNEDGILKEVSSYISGTYQQHYSSDNGEGIQTLDLIEAVGDAEAFCRSNAIKYLSRYDKKGTARVDIMKAMHYCILLMCFNDRNRVRLDNQIESTLHE
tara:strand:- start:3036 stop:3344 length:309 start_codon:yes stop_codon:yes gene_type:complete